MADIYQIALAFTPGIGCTSCRQLIDICGSAEALFSMSRSQLVEIFGNRTAIIGNILSRTAFQRAEEEMRFVERGGLRALFFTDPAFPSRLNQAETQDCPVLIYVQGNADLNATRIVSIVGTRRATQAGRDNTDQLVRQLVPLGTTVVSGLAYGIDTAAHAAAVEHGLPTVAVLGHGLDRIYPPANRGLAEKILAQGGALVTEYPSQTAINPRYFPARNRIIAAMGDATVVVEASEKGGALITAAIAGSYMRTVFAVPGRLTDTYSRGTNNLIAANKALLLRSADDMAYHMGWPMPEAAPVQQELFPALNPTEQRVVDLLGVNSVLALDEIASRLDMPVVKVASVLFNLEMQKIVRPLPGRLYEIRG